MLKVAFAVALIPISLVFLLSLVVIGCELPSLTALANRFAAREETLKTLAAMASQDDAFLVIDPTWLETRDFARSLDPVPALGITTERWNQYKTLLSIAHLSQGIRKDPDSGDIFFIADSFGLLDRGYSRGYLHCGSSLKHEYYPVCSQSLGADKLPAASARTKDYAFRKLADTWFSHEKD